MNPNLSAYPLAVAGIVAIVQLIKSYVPQVSGGVTVLVAALIGGITGLFHFENLDVITGVLLGLGSVGIVTISRNIGGLPASSTPPVTQTTPIAPTTPTAPTTPIAPITTSTESVQPSQTDTSSSQVTPGFPQS